MKKKLLSLFVTALLLVTLVSCSSSNISSGYDSGYDRGYNANTTQNEKTALIGGLFKRIFLKVWCVKMNLSNKKLMIMPSLVL